MAQPTTLSFGNFLVELGNGANPEVFSVPCGFTDKSLEIKGTTGDTEVPDCDNPDAPAWINRDMKSISATVSGQGVLAMSSLPTWQAWALNGTKKDLRVGPATQTLANGGGYFQGVGLLTSFKIDASRGDKCKSSGTIDSDGPWSWVAATA